MELSEFLRILYFTVVFFFVELHFLQTTIHHPDVLRFPLFDNALSNNPLSFYVLEALYLGCMVAMSWRQLVIPVGLLGATFAAVLINMDLQARYQFDYLPLWMFLSFALSEALRKSERFRTWADFPFVVLMGIIYDFSVYHKVINYSFMLTDLPGEVFEQAEGFFGPFCTRADCLILKLVTWGTIPIELLLGILMAVKRWLRPRLVFAILFHWMVAAMAEVIAVSFMLLLIHLLVAHLQNPKVQIFKKRNWWALAGFEAFWLIGVNYLHPYIPEMWEVMFTKTCWVNVFLFPVIFLLLPFFQDQMPDEASLPKMGLPEWLTALQKPRSLAGISAVLFVAANLAFGFAPLFMERQYSVYDVGWAMFSGGYKRNEQYVFKTPADACHSYPNVHGLIFGHREGNEFVYVAKRPEDGERLQAFFQNVRKCPQ